jgi:peptide/nickel transport system ATP-binding protein/oligopeptide transport system ATP-binding protein
MPEKEKNEIIAVKELKKYFPVVKGAFGRKYAEIKAVDNISFSLKKGKNFGLVGESGCGKTTTGKCILRINTPTSGSIIYEGVDLAECSSRELKPYRRDIQLIFQDPYGSLDPRQSSFSIIREALVCDYKKRSKTEIRESVNELLMLVGLDAEIGTRYPHEMSGGQRQRLGIARALACDPKLIVCDEPVSALDVSIQAQVINLFRELQNKLGLTYLFIAHDLAVVHHISDTIAVMYLGNIVELMDKSELYTNSIHPYTNALLSAVPTTNYYGEKKRKRIVLKGEIPSPINTPSGCPFHPRCMHTDDICRNIKPELKNRGDGHRVACHRF